VTFFLRHSVFLLRPTFMILECRSFTAFQFGVFHSMPTGIYWAFDEQSQFLQGFIFSILSYLWKLGTFYACEKFVLQHSVPADIVCCQRTFQLEETIIHLIIHSLTFKMRPACLH